MTRPTPILQTLIDDYNAVRTAGAIGMTVEQVKTIDRLERNATEPVKVERSRGLVRVTFDDDGFTWYDVLVRDDGTLDWTETLRAFPELRVTS